MISIVMPCLNAADDLPCSLPPLVDGVLAGLVSNLIIVDGGSTDETLEIADAAGAEIIETSAGRGHQLAVGAKHSTSDFLLFLHADTVLSAHWVQGAGQFCQDTGPMGERAAYFRFALDDRARAARRLEHMVHLRNAMIGLPYGDQGLLLSRSFYEKLGGFPALPLMEDVAMARAIGRRRLVPLQAEATTSAARYRANGYLRQSSRNLWMLTRYLLGADPAQLVLKYQRRQES